MLNSFIIHWNSSDKYLKWLRWIICDFSFRWADSMVGFGTGVLRPRTLDPDSGNGEKLQIILKQKQSTRPTKRVLWHPTQTWLSNWGSLTMVTSGQLDDAQQRGNRLRFVTKRNSIIHPEVAVCTAKCFSIPFTGCISPSIINNAIITRKNNDHLIVLWPAFLIIKQIHLPAIWNGMPEYWVLTIFNTCCEIRNDG